MAKKTHEQFIHDLYIINPNIKVLNQYNGSESIIQCECLIDGNIWESTAHNLMRGHGCRKCAGTKRLTHSEFVNHIAKINPNITILGQYINQSTKILCECDIDNHQWYAWPENLKKGHGCPKCSANMSCTNLRLSNKEFINRLANMGTLDTVEILDQYRGYNTVLRCRCKICGHNWETKASNLLNNKRCPQCGMKKRFSAITKSYDVFISEIQDINPNINIIGPYVNTHTKIECECLLDGCRWYATPSNLLKGTGCPICNQSKGEQRIKNYLDMHYISYNFQHRFNYCRNKRSLPFDFYIESKNLCIEFDGMQHFQPVNFGGCSNEMASKAYSNTVCNDEIKTKYCKNNGINLLRISYLDQNEIESILDTYFI